MDPTGSYPQHPISTTPTFFTSIHRNGAIPGYKYTVDPCGQSLSRHAWIIHFNQDLAPATYRKPECAGLGDHLSMKMIADTPSVNM